MILATITPTRSITQCTDRIWGLRSCHSAVDVSTTVLPRKVHTHDWGWMGLILLHSPLCLWSVCAGKAGCWFKGKQAFEKEETAKLMFFVHAAYDFFFKMHACPPSSSKKKKRKEMKNLKTTVKSKQLLLPLSFLPLMENRMFLHLNEPFYITHSFL